MADGLSQSRHRSAHRPLHEGADLGLAGGGQLLERATQARTRLARAGALRPKLRERDAGDIIHALMSPEVYGLLLVDRGWPPERYEKWLTQTLVDQLLAPNSV